MTATVVSATPNTIAVTYELWVSDKTSLTTGQIQDAVAAALSAFITSRPIGGDIISPSFGKVYKSAIEAVVGSAVDGVLEVSVTVPAGDVSVSISEVPVLGSITPTIHLVSAGVV